MTTLQAVVLQYLKMMPIVVSNGKPAVDSSYYAVISDLFQDAGHDWMAGVLKSFYERGKDSLTEETFKDHSSPYRQRFLGFCDQFNIYYCAIGDKIFRDFKEMSLPADVEFLASLIYDKLLRSCWNDRNDIEDFLDEMDDQKIKPNRRLRKIIEELTK